MDTVEIPLTKGLVAIIDEADWPLVAPYKWRASKCGSKWYAVASVPGSGRRSRSFYMHRLLMRVPTGKLVDHRDNDGLNNRRANLREATKSQNGVNSAVRFHSKSGIKGVRWEADRNKWVAFIAVKGKRRYLGRFQTAEEASSAYQAAAQIAHGEFAHRAGNDTGKTICLFVPPKGF